MRVSATKPSARVELNQYSTKYRIKNYGLGNDYPQKVIDIIGASGTGSECFNIYTKFVNGEGFNDVALNELVVNTKNETVDNLKQKCGNDISRFAGFALLIKYNGMLEMDEVYHIPFEHCRLEIDKDKNLTYRVAVHPDWTGINGRTFKSEDIKYINRYDPETVAREVVEVGGPVNYLGQVYYFTMTGDFNYPACPFDAIITDMLTEESVSTIKHRNAKNNFLPAGVLVRRGIKPPVSADVATAEDEELARQNQESAEEIKRWQGDYNACKMLVVDIDTDEEKPEFIDFTAKNYDMAYKNTETTVQENIARMFMIPPVLRGVDVGYGFGADKMKEAYSYMNSITIGERFMIETVFKKLFTVKFPQLIDFSIKVLDYKAPVSSIDTALLADLTKNERRSLAGFEPEDTSAAEKPMLAQVIGVGGTQSLVAVVSDPVMKNEQKVQLLIKLFAFTEEEARKIIGTEETTQTTATP